MFVSVAKNVNLNPILCRSLTLIQGYIRQTLNPIFDINPSTLIQGLALNPD